MRSYTPSKRRIKLTPGAAVRIAREMHGMSQLDLEKKTGIRQSAISAIERGDEELGKDRAITLGRALQVHPAVLMFPDLEMTEPAKVRKSR